MREESSLNIRTAASDDIPALISIGRSRPSAPQWSESQYRELFAAQASRNRLILVCEAATTVRGFLVASQVESEWELESIVVNPSSGRKGVGTRLIEALVRHASKSGAGSIMLEVRQSNSAARGLYEKCGFRLAGMRKAYYSSPLEDAVMYRCAVPPSVSP